jgi:hypothetical protein
LGDLGSSINSPMNGGLALAKSLCGQISGFQSFYHVLK